ncbi:hypothetical protein AAFR86_13010 [Salmonella enterica subsp. diarizonae serovar 58:r:z53]
MKKREAVILAPVMPVWDEGQFCAPLVMLLVAKGYHVTVIDTLTLIQDASPERAVEALCQALNARFQSPYLLVGFAMAGTLAAREAGMFTPVTNERVVQVAVREGATL